MFKDRVFNVSFLISCGWHLFCIFAFVLIITPKGFTINQFPETAFLGAILETDVFQQAGRGTKPVFMTTPYKEDFASGYNYIDARLLPEEDAERARFIEPEENKQIPDFLDDTD